MKNARYILVIIWVLCAVIKFGIKSEPGFGLAVLYFIMFVSFMGFFLSFLSNKDE
jgi:hypothetical protein